MFVRSTSFADMEVGTSGQWASHVDPLENAFLPREHRLLELVHGWVAGVLPWLAVLLFLVGVIPFSVLLFTLLASLCFLACLRTLALSALVQRLQRLQVQLEAGGEGEAGRSGAASASTLPPASLLNLRFSLLSREFMPSDYEALLALDAGSRARVPVTQAQLASLPSYRHSGRCKAGGKEGSSGCGEDEPPPRCAVCLERYAGGCAVTALPCAHTFHSGCIMRWLRQQGATATCPICKARVFYERDVQL